MDRTLPSRPAVRVLREEPTLKKSNNDKLDASRIAPYTDTLEPYLRNVLQEIPEPECVMSSMDKFDPKIIKPYNEVDEPERKKSSNTRT
jgi:hypothetical protein